MIEVSRKKLNNKIELKVGDAEHIPWNDNTFEAIICNASFHHYPNPEKVLLEMRRVLTDNGKLIIGDPTAPVIIRQLMNFGMQRGNDGDYKIYSKKEIEGLLIKCGFKPFNWKKPNYKTFVISASV